MQALYLVYVYDRFYRVESFIIAQASSKIFLNHLIFSLIP